MLFCVIKTSERRKPTWLSKSKKAKDSAQGVTAKGIHCLELTAQGYSSQEIAAIVHAEAATVRMWMTKARRYLRSIPELRQYAYSEVAG